MFILAALLMVTLLHTVSSVAFVQADFMLSTLRILLFGTLTWSTGATVLASNQQDLLDKIPRDARTAISKLKLNVDITEYAVCPSCCAIYPPDQTKPNDAYPHHCTHSQTDKGVCGARLVNKKKLSPPRVGDPPRIVYEPIKSYPYRSLKSWIAELLSQRDIEELLLNSWDSVAKGGALCHDILGSACIQGFLGPDGRTLFSVQSHGAIHLVFSLFVDWFNPHGNKRAGKSHSIGAVYMACENLPPHLRFRPENIYLTGIIPGKHEPGVDQLHHFLRPLVDELLELWHHGIQLRRTAMRFTGRLVRAAVIPLVCDLPAVRKVAGIAHYRAHHFCSFCGLTNPDINSTDRENWPPSKTWSEHCQHAIRWREARTEKERDELFKDHGIRWSELLRLEYWDPTRFTLLDSMHNLFLGELRHHCMEIFRMDVIAGQKPSKRNAHTHTPAQQQTCLDAVLKAVCRRSKSALEAVRRDYLLAVAQFNDIVMVGVEPTKSAIAEALLTWVSLCLSFYCLRSNSYDRRRRWRMSRVLCDSLPHCRRTVTLFTFLTCRRKGRVSTIYSRNRSSNNSGRTSQMSSCQVG